MNKGKPALLQRYIAWGWGLSFKIMLFFVTLFPVIFAPIIFFSDPNSPNVKMDFGELSQNQAALLSLLFGMVGTSLYLAYLKYLKPKFSDYVPKKGDPKDWLN